VSQERQHRLGDVFWRETLIDASIFREWMLCIGRHSATEHMAHLLREFVVRLKAMGLVGDDKSFAYPITQAEVGDALGITNVHVRRVLQDIREKSLIAWERGRVTVLDWDGLVALGEFDPSYLHLTRKKPA
jgi:CRP-like cAMP-binding protein